MPTTSEMPNEKPELLDNKATENTLQEAVQSGAQISSEQLNDFSGQGLSDALTDNLFGKPEIGSSNSDSIQGSVSSLDTVSKSTDVSPGVRDEMSRMATEERGLGDMAADKLSETIKMQSQYRDQVLNQLAAVGSQADQAGIAQMSAKNDFADSMLANEELA